MSTNEEFGRFLSNIYPCAMVNGVRMDRTGTKTLSDFRLDVETAEYLGLEHVGVFMERCGDNTWLQRKLSFLTSSPGDGIWVMVARTRLQYDVLYNRWHGQEETAQIADQQLRRFWTKNKLIFSTPESLKHVLAWIRENSMLVSGIILVDASSVVHKARGNDQFNNDRPQHVVNFRASLTRMGWAPPLMLMTQKLAKSVPTEQMRQAYSLEAWWYVEGATISFKARESQEESG